MKPYFNKMADMGHELTKGQIKRSKENIESIKKTEADILEAIEEVKQAGFPTEKINARGQMIESSVL
jgi:glutaconyl-CoA decarboxylase